MFHLVMSQGQIKLGAKHENMKHNRNPGMYFWLPIQEPSCRIGLVEAAFASVGESVVDRGHLCGRKVWELKVGQE